MTELIPGSSRILSDLLNWPCDLVQLVKLINDSWSNPIWRDCLTVLFPNNNNDQVPLYER